MRKRLLPRPPVSQVPAHQSRRSRKLLLEMLEGRLALAIDGLGVAGDSWSDEYAAESYNYARNWAELLVSERGIDLGAPGDYPDERGDDGTAFNWAQVGATADDMINQLQDFSIIDQYEAGDVSHAVFMTSNADFAPGSMAFNNIADGTWNASSFEVDFFIMRFDELLIGSLGSKALKTIVTTIPDPTMTPLGRTLSDAAGRQRVRDVVEIANTRIKAKAAEYHLPVVDLAALQTQLLGTPASPAASRTIGGVAFNPNGAGTAITNLFIEGGILPHTVYQAYVANAIIEGLNTAYGENIPRLTEQEIVEFAGLTYGGNNTFPLNYSNLVIAPPVTVFLSYGNTGSPADDFTARVSEWANGRDIPELSPDSGGNPGELSLLKAKILANLQTAFAGTRVNFTDVLPFDTRFEAIKLGEFSGDVVTPQSPLTSAIGRNEFDWLNKNDQSTGHVFVDLVTHDDPLGRPDYDNIDLSTLPRAEQLRYLENVMTFYIANEVGRGMGLQAADAYGYPSITTENAANTGGVQLLDYMSGDQALGFSPNVFNGTPTFSFSPLAKAKLQYGRWLTNPALATIAEVGTAHNTTATAQTITLVNSSTSQQRVGVVNGAAVSGGSEVDLYRISGAAVGDKITAQVLSTGVYGSAINSAIRLLAADGTMVLAFNDDTLLGNNRLNQAGDTNVDLDALIMNYVVETAGDVYIEVKSNGSAGSYDLMVTNTVAAVPNPFPWHNASNPLNVTGNTTGTAVTAFDVIPIINVLNLNPTGFPLPTPDGTFAPPPFLDVSPNGTVTAFDAIPVINYLNLNPLGGPGLEFVPFEEGSAGEATEPEPIAAPVAAAEEPSPTNRSASSSSNSALPYQPMSTASSLVAGQSSGRIASNFASNPLTWLLLAPISEGSEESEEESGSASEEQAQALEALLGEE